MRPDSVSRIFSRSVIDVPGNPSSAENKNGSSKSGSRHVHYDEFEEDSKTTFTQQRGCFMSFWRIALLVTFVVGALLLVGLLVGYLAPCEKEKLKHIQAHRFISEKRRGRARDTKGDPKHHAEDDKWSKSVRLPQSVQPIHYKLGIQPHLPPENFTTDGYVEITVKCLVATKSIVLHANDLNVSSVNITGDGHHADLTVYNMSKDPLKQFLQINLDKYLKPKHNYVISMQFVGEINNQSHGLYRSSYKDESGDISWMAVSQLQPTDARRVFPCFDEPALKATFEVAIIRKKEMTSLSNMPTWKTEPWSEEWEVDLYNTTVPMSTYLLAFVIGQISPFDETNDKFQVWSRESGIQFGEYAYTIGPKLLTFYEEFFGVPYPLPKTDMVAVPEFLFAAMENWGLIIYEESALLYDPKRSSLEDKTFVTVVVAHELAHQWFGNLVTPAWWDDLWLNEGFATYVEYLGAAAVQPDWGMDQQFLTDVYEVMETDSLQSSHPIRNMASDPDEIMELFDDISYLKGGAIIRMMEHFLGSENFRKGLQVYLKELSFKSATQEDLWKYLNQSSETGEDVKEVMDTWTLQPGYPLVTVSRDYADNSVEIRQTEYYLKTEEEKKGKSVVKKESDRNLWTIPITYTDGVNTSWTTETRLWLKSRAENLPAIASNDTWLMVNVQQVGYYRVNYDLRNWELLISQLVEDHSEIHVINRAQILNDALNLARSDHLPYPLALNITIYLLKESDYLPWSAALSAFQYMDLMLGKTEAYGTWKEYILLLSTPVYDKLGWIPESQDEIPLTSFLRSNILRWTCNYGGEHCIETATKLFQQWKRSPSEQNGVSPDILDVVLCTGIAYGKSKDWDFVWETYLKEDLKTQKNTLLRSLACAREPWLLERLLTWAIKPGSGIKIQDGSHVFAHIADNVYGRDILYRFFRKNLKEIFRIYGSALGMAEIVEYSTAGLNTEFDVQELGSFMMGRSTEGWGTASAALRQAVERSSANVRWMAKNYDVIEEWLKQRRSEYT